MFGRIDRKGKVSYSLSLSQHAKHPPLMLTVFFSFVRTRLATLCFLCTITFRPTIPRVIELWSWEAVCGLYEVCRGAVGKRLTGGQSGVEVDVEMEIKELARACVHG